MSQQQKLVWGVAAIIGGSIIAAAYLLSPTRPAAQQTPSANVSDPEVENHYFERQAENSN